MFEDTNPRSLKELLGEIHDAKSALPEFQRDFVWDPSATKELIVSIAKGFPAGSILRIHHSGDNSLFASREFQGAKPLNENQPTFLVLDGQQRLTSLYQSFYGVGDYRYFIELKKLLAGEEFEECIFSLKETRAKRYEEEIATQAEELLLPLSILQNEAFEKFSSWILKVSGFLHSDNANALVRLQEELQGKIQNRWIQTINDYKFPVVTLPGNTEAEAVCTIFETLNRTGVRLSAFDLLTARFWPQGINLRGDWEEARQQYPLLDSMEIDPYYLLQALTLCARQTPGCKRSEVLGLKGEDFRAWWPRIVEGYSKALEYLQEACGVITPKWLPYAAIPIPMAAVLAKTSSLVGPQVGANQLKLTRWYWCSVLNQTYENPPNSQAAKDFVELQEWLSGGREPSAVSNFNPDEVGDLRQVTSRQRALYKGLMGLIIQNGAKDFHTLETITGEVMRARQIDDHHIFPDAYLRGEKQKYPPNAGDHILNRTLIDSETNKRIGKNPPSKYISEIEQALAESGGNTGQIFESHFCSIDELKADEVADFWSSRESKIRNAIKEVTS